MNMAFIIRQWANSHKAKDSNQQLLSLNRSWAAKSLILQMCDCLDRTNSTWAPSKTDLFHLNLLHEVSSAAIVADRQMTDVKHDLNNWKKYGSEKTCFFGVLAMAFY